MGRERRRERLIKETNTNNQVRVTCNSKPSNRRENIRNNVTKLAVALVMGWLAFNAKKSDGGSRSTATNK